MQAARSRHPYGATSKDTNFIHEVTTIPKQTQDSQLTEALEAALDKKAQDVVVIDLDDICSFTDHFIICTGTSSRHNQTIAEGIDERLRKEGVRPLHIEGHKEGEWILLDYIDFVVHIFTAKAREFYDLERLWRAGKRRTVPVLTGQRS
jgi:ribosome-associated protein